MDLGKKLHMSLDDLIKTQHAGQRKEKVRIFAPAVFYVSENSAGTQSDEHALPATFDSHKPSACDRECHHPLVSHFEP